MLDYTRGLWRLDTTEGYFQVFLAGFRRLITDDVSSGGIVHKIKIFNSAETSCTNWCRGLSVLNVCNGLFLRARINYRPKCKRCQVTRTFFILSYFLFFFSSHCNAQIHCCVLDKYLLYNASTIIYYLF